MVEEVGLKNSIFNKAKTYSLGMKQKLALVQALITKPKLLILDEPTNGLDPLATVQIRELLKKVSTEDKVSILISSHILGEIEQLCDRVVFINDGRIVKNEKLMTSEENKFVIVTKKMSECIRVLKNESFVCGISSLKNKLLVTIMSNSSQEIIKVLTRNNIENNKFQLKNAQSELPKASNSDENNLRPTNQIQLDSNGRMKDAIEAFSLLAIILTSIV